MSLTFLSKVTHGLEVRSTHSIDFESDVYRLLQGTGKGCLASIVQVQRIL